MSSQEESDHATKPVKEHEWLMQLVGEWKVVSEMNMPDGETAKGEGRETTRSLGGLFAQTQGGGKMPDGGEMEYHQIIGWDVSFKEYRATWYCNVSSHIWNYTCTLSEDGKTLTMDCKGPDFEKDGVTADYRDVMTIIDENTRTYTSSGQAPDGSWYEFMKSTYTRIG
jgi:hypothetical protein